MKRNQDVAQLVDAWTLAAYDSPKDLGLVAYGDAPDCTALDRGAVLAPRDLHRLRGRSISCTLTVRIAHRRSRFCGTGVPHRRA
jgi:hypothetical protein